MKRTFDGNLLPFGGGRMEQPEPRRLIQERLEGKQIAWAHVDEEPGPTGSAILGLEFTGGERLVIMATRDLNSKTWTGDGRAYLSRIVFAWMPPQMIWTPRMERHFGRGRPAGSGEPDLEHQLEGQVIVDVRNLKEPTSWNGEQMFMTLRGGDVLFLASDHQARDRRYRAELIADLRRASRVILPGGQIA